MSNTINLSDLKIAEKTLVDVMERYLPTAEIDLEIIELAPNSFRLVSRLGELEGLARVFNKDGVSQTSIENISIGSIAIEMIVKVFVVPLQLEPNIFKRDL